MNWDDFRLVKAIAAARSLVGAADTLGLNHSTIFRRLGQIESELGVALFERSRSGYATTAAGEEMVALANTMSDGILQFERRLAGQDERPSGELRVAIADSLFVCLFAPIFADFRAAYPNIRLDIVVSDTELNLSQRAADVAIRAASIPNAALVGRKVAPLAWSAYAKAGSQLAKADPLGPEATYIGYGPPIENIDPARWLEHNVPAHRIAMRVNTIFVAAAAARAGLGLAILPHFVGDFSPDLERVALQPPSADDLWLLTHIDLKGAARVRAFMDFVCSRLNYDRADCLIG